MRRKKKYSKRKVKEKQLYSDLSYFKLQLDVISETANNLKGLFPEEKIEIKQKLSIPMLYCVDRGFKIKEEGRHIKLCQ